MSKHSSAAPVYGVDIGNKFAYAAVAEGLEKDPLPMMPDDHLRVGIPTEAYVAPPDGAQIQVYPRKKGGRAAHRVKTVKRQLGRSLTLEGIAQPVSPERIYAAIVRDVVQAANAAAEKVNRPKSYRVVYTYPAAFARGEWPETAGLLDRMEAAINSVELDGTHLEVVGRLSEPGAAALDYLHYRQYTAPAELRLPKTGEYNVLVYDKGEGTTDAALVTARSTGEPYEVLTWRGDPGLGCRDYEKLILDEITAQLRAAGCTADTPRVRQELARFAEEMKLELSDWETSTRELTVSEEEDGIPLTVTRQRFEELAAPLLARTMAMTEEVLAEARSRGVRVDAVVLTGGGSQMPMVKRAMEELVQGACPVDIFRPSTAVANGAALYAAMRSDIALFHSQQCYGLRVPDARLLEGAGRMLVAKDAKLPAVSQTVEYRVPASGSMSWTVLSSEQEGERVELERCGEVVRLNGFDGLTPGETCRFTLAVDEDLHVTVACARPDGTVLRRSSRELLRRT